MSLLMVIIIVAVVIALLYAFNRLVNIPGKLIIIYVVVFILCVWLLEVAGIIDYLRKTIL